MKGSHCKILQEPLDKVKQNAEAFFTKIDEMRRFVGLTSYKRGLLVEKYQKGMELAIHRAQANAQGKDLDTLLDDLGAFIVLDGLLWDVTDWWATATYNGIARRLHLKYLQYKRPLDLLSAEMGRAEEFKTKIRNIKKLDEESTIQAIAIVDDKVKEIQRNMDFITTRGWKGALEAQIKSATKRILSVPSTNTACHKATDEFFILANKGIEFDAYELAEAKYKEHVDLCVKN